MFFLDTAFLVPPPSKWSGGHFFYSYVLRYHPLHCHLQIRPWVPAFSSTHLREIEPASSKGNSSDTFGSEDDEHSPTCCLDLLPTELVDIAFRFFSRIPAAEIWEKYILVKQVAELYGVGRAFTTFSNRLYTQCVSRSLHSSDENTVFRKRRA